MKKLKLKIEYHQLLKDVLMIVLIEIDLDKQLVFQLNHMI